MPTLNVTLDGEIDFEVFCVCGNGLCKVTEVEQSYGKNRITIEPCDKCMAAEYDEGFQTGYDQGREDYDCD